MTTPRRSATSGSEVRVAGSGFTIFQFKGKTLLYCQTLQDTAPAPVAQAVPVQSITDTVPSEIVTARAVGPGTIRLTMYEGWTKSIWQEMTDFESATTLLEVFEKQAGLGPITCKKIIKKAPRNGVGGYYRVKTYNNCKITDIDEGEQVNIASMLMPKSFSIMYTHATWGKS